MKSCMNLILYYIRKLSFDFGVANGEAFVKKFGDLLLPLSRLLEFLNRPEVLLGKVANFGVDDLI